MGDSVVWGQGLEPGDKFDEQLRVTLATSNPGGATLEALAHSGAVIDERGGANNTEPGEVPVSCPSIREQCAAFTNHPDAVDVVVLNGGINDVGLTTILNPLAGPLKARVRSACFEKMLVLLREVTAKFSKPTCRILLAGYYTILSSKSHPLGINRMLGLYGIRQPSFVGKGYDFASPVVDRCEQFSRLSTDFLQNAIDATGDLRARLVKSGFTDANAAFVKKTSLLWGLLPNLSAEDPVALARQGDCRCAYPDVGNFLEREICFRASVGHPNLRGAVRYHDQLVAALP
jgi:hypothetical protein